jgi:hypothetical protein
LDAEGTRTQPNADVHSHGEQVGQPCGGGQGGTFGVPPEARVSVMVQHPDDGTWSSAIDTTGYCSSRRAPRMYRRVRGPDMPDRDLRLHGAAARSIAPPRPLDHV